MDGGKVTDPGGQPLIGISTTGKFYTEWPDVDFRKSLTRYPADNRTGNNRDIFTFATVS